MDINFNKIKLKNCGHKFCIDCLSYDVISFQWFNGFSTNDPLHCPTCNSIFCDNDWSFITDKLVKMNLLQRNVVFTYYLTPDWVNKLYLFVDFNREYSLRERDTLEDFVWNNYGYSLYRNIYADNIPSVVYFNRLDGYRKNSYSFKIDYPSIRSKNEQLFKEQEILVWKRSQRQFTSTRSQTIYSQGIGGYSSYTGYGIGLQ
jgi:hypothetical protein